MKDTPETIQEPSPETQDVKKEEYEKLYKLAKQTIKLDRKLINSAISNLQTYASSQKDKGKNLLEDEDDFIYVTITLSKVPSKFSPKPLQIELKHAIYGPKYLTHVCMIVKDPQRAFKDQVQDLDIPCLGKVIGYQKLMKNFKEYKDRRQLVNEFDLFFCDSRIYSMLPKVTGKYFYLKKKFPVPLKLAGSEKTIEETFEEAMKCTYFMPGNGPNYTIKIGRTSMNAKNCVSNIVNAVYKALPLILGNTLKPTKVQSITLKTQSSIELPIYNHLSKGDIAAYLEHAQATETKNE